MVTALQQSICYTDMLILNNLLSCIASEKFRTQFLTRNYVLIWEVSMCFIALRERTFLVEELAMKIFLCGAHYSMTNKTHLPESQQMLSNEIWQWKKNVAAENCWEKKEGFGCLCGQWQAGWGERSLRCSTCRRIWNKTKNILCMKILCKWICRD